MSKDKYVTKQGSIVTRKYKTAGSFLSLFPFSSTVALKAYSTQS